MRRQAGRAVKKGDARRAIPEHARRGSEIAAGDRQVEAGRPRRHAGGRKRFDFRRRIIELRLAADEQKAQERKPQVKLTRLALQLSSPLGSPPRTPRKQRSMLSPHKVDVPETPQRGAGG